MIFNMLCWKNYLFAVILVAAVYGFGLLGKHRGKGLGKPRVTRWMGQDGWERIVSPVKKDGSRASHRIKRNIPVIRLQGTELERFFLETAELTERLEASVSLAVAQCWDKKRLVSTLRALVAGYPRMNHPAFQKGILSVVIKKLAALDCHEYTEHDLKKLWMKGEP